MKFELTQTVYNQIEDLNQKANDLLGYRANDIKNWLADLQKNGTAIVGYRTACGSTDKTHKVYRIWLKAVKLLSKNGVKLQEENMPVDNKSPTMAGGFWNEIRYSID